MGDLHTSSLNALKTTLIRNMLMRPVFSDVEVGDVAALNPPASSQPFWTRGDCSRSIMHLMCSRLSSAESQSNEH